MVFKNFLFILYYTSSLNILTLFLKNKNKNKNLNDVASFLSPHLRRVNRMEWKEIKIKIIILEYSSLPLLASFNGKSIPSFSSLSERE